MVSREEPDRATLRRLALERLNEDMYPAEVYPSQLARTLAEAEAAGREVYTEEGARGVPKKD